MTLLLCLTLVSADPGLSIPPELKLNVLIPLQSELSLPDPAAEGAGPSFRDVVDSVRYPVDGDEWLADPFMVLGDEMDSSAVDLGDGDVTRSATRTQPRILSRPDRLVTLLEKKCSGSGPAGSNPSWGCPP